MLKPTVNMLSDPDYINQTIVLWVSDDFITLQTILDLARFDAFLVHLTRTLVFIRIYSTYLFLSLSCILDF